MSTISCYWFISSHTIVITYRWNNQYNCYLYSKYSFFHGYSHDKCKIQSSASVTIGLQVHTHVMVGGRICTTYKHLQHVHVVLHTSIYNMYMFLSWLYCKVCKQFPSADSIYQRFSSIQSVMNLEKSCALLHL